MRTLLALLLLTLSSSCVVGGKSAINLYGAQRSYSGDFGDADPAPAVGIEGMAGVTPSGLSVEGGYAYSDKSDSGYKLTTNEFYAGARKTWNTDSLVQPYVAGGVDWLHGDAEAPGNTSSDGNGIGGYARAGIGFQIAIFQAGVDLRGVLTSAEIGFENASFVQAGIFIGVSL